MSIAPSADTVASAGVISVLLPRPRAGVVYQRVMDGAVLLSTTDEIYFGLNAVGADVWEQLPPATTTFDALCDAIVARYPDATPAQVREDVAELLAALRGAGLVAVAE